MADLFVDGGSRTLAATGEVHGAAAWRIVGARGVLIDEGVRFVPGASPQEAELVACFLGLERCLDLKLQRVSVFTDCGSTEDVLRNMRAFRCGTPLCVATANKIRRLLKRASGSLVGNVQRVTRRHPGIQHADALCDSLLATMRQVA